MPAKFLRTLLPPCLHRFIPPFGKQIGTGAVFFPTQDELIGQKTCRKQASFDRLGRKIGTGAIYFRSVAVWAGMSGMGVGLAMIGGCEVGPRLQVPASQRSCQLRGGRNATTGHPTGRNGGHRQVVGIVSRSSIEPAHRTRHQIQPGRSAGQARVAEARAQLEGNVASLFPTVDGPPRTRAAGPARTPFSIGGSSGPGSSTGTGGTTTGGSGTGTGGTSGGGTTSSGTTPRRSHLASDTTNLYQAGFDAGWEIDVFGGTRRAIEAAHYTLDAQVDARRNATITLLSEVARNYIILRGLQQELAIVRDNVASQNDFLDLTKAKFQAGIATDLDVARQQAQVASTEAEMPTLQTEIQQAIHRLGVLLDRNPTDLEAELTPTGPLPGGPPEVPAGLPSDLLAPTGCAASRAAAGRLECQHWRGHRRPLSQIESDRLSWF